MLTDAKAGEPARQQLLDEIRKRAEEAELARIEAEELKLALESPTASVPSADPAPSGLDLLHDSEVTDLRDELAQALVDNDLERATALHNELIALLPDDPIVDQIGAEITRRREANAPKDSPAAPPTEERSQIADLLNAANEAYQRELYDIALQNIATLLTLDPENAAALELQGNIRKAKELAERLEAEEKKRRLEQEQQPAPSVQPSVAIDTPPAELPEPLPPPSPPTEAHTAVHVPTPAVRKVVNVLMRHRWSVVLAGVLVFLGVQTASVIYHQLRTTVFREHVSLLIVPVAHADGGTAPDDLTMGLADDLTARLAQFRDIEVFATETGLRRHASDGDGTRLAREVGASFVLTLSTVARENSTYVRMVLRKLSEGRVVAGTTYPMQRSKLALIHNDAIPTLIRAMGIPSDESQTRWAMSLPLDGTYEAYLVARSLMHHPEPGGLDSATQVLQRIIGQDSLFADAQILWGQTRVLLYETGRDTSHALLQQAYASLQRGMGLGAKGSGVYTLWGMIDYYSARYHEAIERLSRAVEVAPSDAEAQRRLALALLRVGKTEQAVDAARRAVQYDPHNPLSHALLGNLSLLLGNAQTALQALQTEASLRPAHERHRSDTYVAALVANDRREQALDVVKQNLTIEPDTIAALYDLGRMYQLAGKSKRMWDEVLGHARKLVLQQLKVRPHDAQLYSYLSLIETRLGNFKEGTQARSRALALAPDNYETLYYAARVAALQGGQSPEAYALLAKAIYRRFSLQQILDLDLLALRSDQEFVRKITQ